MGFTPPHLSTPRPNSVTVFRVGANAVIEAGARLGAGVGDRGPVLLLDGGSQWGSEP